MKRYTIAELVETKRMGFVRQADAKKFHAALLPLEPIVRRVYSCEEDTVILESKSYSSKFDITQFEAMCRFFKDADRYLANCTSEASKRDHTHLLVFDLGQGYFALLTPFLGAKQ